MEDSTMTSEQSLALIESMINKAKNQFRENGHLYLIWGWVVFFCSMVHYIFGIRMGHEKAGMVWMLTWVAIIYQVIYIVRLKKKVRVTTYTDDILNAIWVVFAIAMVVVVLIIHRQLGNDFYKVLDALILTIYGVPTFLSGVILRFNALKAGGICCWVLAILSTFFDPHQHLLFISMAMVIAWIIPGYLLRRRYKKDQIGY